MNFEKTPRGFLICRFKDAYGHSCSIQESSLATDEAIWIGIDDASPKIMASLAAQHGVETDKTTGWVPFPIPDDVLLHTRMHLTRDQVEDLIPVLQKFVDTGEIE